MVRVSMKAVKYEKAHTVAQKNTLRRQPGA
jgi:hypothetical protein